MFTKSEIETLDSIVYNDLGRKLQDEGYTVKVNDNGEIIVSHKDTLMPRINFSTYTDANDKVSFFAEMKFDATFEVDEEMEEDVDSICDEIESIADKMRISDCEVTYTIQGNTDKGIPYFSIKVKVNGRLLCSYDIEPGEDMDRKRTSIMRSVKRYFDGVGSTDYIDL